ncbi:MAG: polysaccharide deacetylase family protein [Aquificales bacterium]|nr:polysaccharide deacetylase family protein [Aquificales bacterium]
MNQARHIWGSQRLTVLAYHRVTNLYESGFDLFAPNVSATPSTFASQMDFVGRHFHVVSLDDVLDWLDEQRPLPPNPLLITFDDGYRDNLQYAFPVLQQHGFPAIIYLATNYIGEKKPFFWDLTAYCFYHTAKDTAVLPLVGSQHWSDESGRTAVMDNRTAVMDNWLNNLKKLPNHEKETAVQQLPQALDVTISDDAFADLCLTWEQVRAMSQSSITFGAHTQNHPILTRISLEEARDEITGSKARITDETGRDVVSFAYPNGQSSDFNKPLIDILKQAGISVAFTLLSGPSRPEEVRNAPWAIRRIFIGHHDDMPHFAAKVMGLTRLMRIFG